MSLLIDDSDADWELESAAIDKKDVRLLPAADAAEVWMMLELMIDDDVLFDQDFVEPIAIY